MLLMNIHISPERNNSHSPSQHRPGTSRRFCEASVSYVQPLTRRHARASLHAEHTHRKRRQRFRVQCRLEFSHPALGNRHPRQQQSTLRQSWHRYDFTALSLPRRGNTSGQLEDAVAGAAATGRFAVADGASESCFADLWAELLVEEFVSRADCEPGELRSFLPNAQKRWQENMDGRTLPWFAEEGVRKGAFATFLGLAIATSGRSLRWQAAAVGDSCLFHVRKNTLQKSFPLDSWKQFGTPSAPARLTHTSGVDWRRDGSKKQMAGANRKTSFSWQRMHLAQWCLGQHEAGENPWQQIASLVSSPTSEMDFPLWIDEKRDTGPPAER